MRHREALGKFLEWLAADEAADRALPLQSEIHGDVELRWWPTFKRSRRLVWSFAVAKEPEIDPSPAVKARASEIRDQLFQWEKNEADWPLARKS
jgi:hypothetical protein